MNEKLRRGSRGKLPVKILVVSNPNPNPHVALESLGDGAEIPRHAHRPETRVRTQPFQLQRGMCRVLKKLFVRGAGGVLDSSRKHAIIFPEGCCSERLHDRWSKSPSCISEKQFGSALNCAAISSPSAVSAGRGCASDRICSHAAAPFNSGRMAGKSATSFSRSAAGSAWIAVSIS